MARLAPFRRIVRFASCYDVLEGKRLVRMMLECHHEIVRHDDDVYAEQRQRCDDCLRGKRGRRGRRAASKAALAGWGL